MPPLYQSTGDQYSSASLEAMASGLWGSIYRRKYQDEPAHWGMVSVSRTAGPPQQGQVVLTQSVWRARGLSPSGPGSKSTMSGRVRGRLLSGRGCQPHFSHLTIGMGSPQ